MAKTLTSGGRAKPKTLLFTLYLIVFLNSFGYFLIFPVLSNMIFGQSSVIPTGWSHTLGDYLFSVVLGAGTLAGLLFAPFIGRLSDHIGRRKILLFCTLLTAISFLLPMGALTLGSVALFLLGNVVNGIASNNQAIALAAISDVSQIQRSKTLRFAIDTAVICLAMSTGPLAGSLLSNSQLFHGFTQSTPFEFAFGLTLVSLFLLYQFLPETYAPQTHSHLKSNLKFIAVFQHALRDIFTLAKPLRWMFLISFLVQMSWAQFFQYLYFYYPTQFHWSNTRVSVYTSLLGVYFVIGLLGILPTLLKYFQKISLHTLIFLSIFIAGLSFLGLTCSGISLQWIFAIPLSLTIGIYYPCLLTLMSEQSGPTHQGWILSLNGAIMGISWLITSFSALWLSTFSPTLPLYLSALMTLIASGIAGGLS